MAQVQAAKLIQGNRRNGVLLSYNGYMYARNRIRVNKVYWRCVEPSCGIFLHTGLCSLNVGAVVAVAKEPTRHSHPQEDLLISEREITQQIVSVVVADPCAPVRAAYDNVVANVGPGSSQGIPSFAAIERTLRRKRNASFPPLPRVIHDVDISNEWSLTWKDKEHLSLIDNQWGIVVFLTDKNARLLSHCTTIFVDGTFRTAPHPYTQLVTIHGMYMNCVVPLCFCLSTGKTVAQYRQLFRHVREKIRTLCRRRWNPHYVICDFELPLITAAESEFIGCRVRGCYFHFSQSLWRKVQALGLVSAYRSNTSDGRKLKKCIQKIMAIGFLPTVSVRTSFENYVASTRVIRLQIQFRRLAEFVQYVYAVYVGPNATFRPPMWNVFTRNMDVRTNNSVEGYGYI